MPIRLALAFAGVLSVVAGQQVTSYGAIVSNTFYIEPHDYVSGISV